MNIDTFIQLFAERSPFIIVPAAFTVFGMGYTLYSFHKFLTVDNAFSHNLNPKYDSLYYGLQLLSVVGWTGFAVLMFLNIMLNVNNKISSPILMAISWAILALGIGLQLLLRTDMMIAVTNYKADHASPPWRYFYRMQAKRMGDSSPLRKNFQRFIGLVFGLIGAVILAAFAFAPSSAKNIDTEIDALVTAFKAAQNTSSADLEPLLTRP